MTDFPFDAESAPRDVALIDTDNWICVIGQDGAVDFYGHSGSFTAVLDESWLTDTDRYRLATLGDVITHAPCHIAVVSKSVSRGT